MITPVTGATTPAIRLEDRVGPKPPAALSFADVMATQTPTGTADALGGSTDQWPAAERTGLSAPGCCSCGNNMNAASGPVPVQAASQPLAALSTASEVDNVARAANEPLLFDGVVSGPPTKCSHEHAPPSRADPIATSTDPRTVRADINGVSNAQLAIILRTPPQIGTFWLDRR